MTGFVAASPALVASAIPAGAVVALLARRGLGRGRAGLAWGAATARGLAVAAALVGAAGISRVTESATTGVVHAAASPGSAANGADAVVRWTGTAPSAAIERARAALPSDRPGDLVAVWDAAGPAPGTQDVASLRPRGAPVTLVGPEPPNALPTLGPPPRLVAPTALVQGVPFRLRYESGPEPWSTTSATFSIDGHEATLALAADGRDVVTPDADVRAGSHVVVLRVAGREPAATVLHVAPPPSVLVVTTSGLEPPLARRLRTQGLDVKVVSDAVADLAPPADVVILGPGTGVRCATDVASRVATGAGVLALGGEKERGLARLRGTDLEPILPAELPAPPPPPEPEPPRPPERPPTPDAPKPVLDEGEKRALRVALLLCIDRSGSMSGRKIAMAREAAVAAARTLSAGDRVAVIAFDEQPAWIAPFQDAGEIRTLATRIGELDAGGGTNFFPALRIGFDEVLRQDCGIRHVILLTDGATRAAVFRDMVESASGQGVTLSTVAVGEDADTHLLGLLAQWGGGRLYPAVEADRLPQVITLDTRRFTRKTPDAEKPRPPADDVPAPPEQPRPAPTADRPEPPRETPPALRTPRVAAPSPFLAGVENEPWPRLIHAETVRPRPNASVPLVWSDDGAPALVLGRAGAGRAAVLAADACSADARELWDWPESGRALAQLARFLAPSPAPSDRSPAVTFHALPGGAAVAVVAAPAGGRLRLRHERGDTIDVLCTGDGANSVAHLDAMPAEGVWTGEFAAGEGAAEPIACGSPGPPLRAARLGPADLASLAGARRADALPARRPGEPVEHRDDLSPRFLVGAALLLVVEAALRRGVRG